MDPLIGSALISGGSSLLGGLFGKSSAKKAAAAANAFTEKQMKNRHQWEVDDLRKAGLNPILSAGGTPSMGSSAMEQQVNPNIIGDAVSSALSAKRLKAEIENIQQDTEKKESEKNTTDMYGALARLDYSIKEPDAITAKALSRGLNDIPHADDVMAVGKVLGNVLGGAASIGNSAAGAARAIRKAPPPLPKSYKETRTNYDAKGNPKSGHSVERNY